MEKTITLHLLQGGTVDVPVSKIHTIADNHKGAIVTVVENGKIKDTHQVYEVPSRIRHLMSN